MAGKSQANRKPQQLQLRIGQPFKYSLKPGRNTDGFTSMGHGHEDHGHGKMELPDYRQWKVEGTPMEVVQERLAKKGLRDPWARNEAWRFMGGFATPVTFKDVLLRGAKWGFAAFVVALGVEYAFFPPKKNGGHH